MSHCVIDCDCGQLRVGAASAKGLWSVLRYCVGIAPGVGGETGPLKLWPTDRTEQDLERGVLRRTCGIGAEEIGEAGEEKKDADGPGVLSQRNGHRHP